MHRLAPVPLAALALAVLAGCGGGDDAPASPVDDAVSDATGPGDAAPAGDGAGDPAGQEAATQGDSPFAVPTGPAGGGEPDGSALPGDVGAPDNGPEGQTPVGRGADTAAIAGLWDYTRDVPAGSDAGFFEISEDGTVTEYDYQADDAGSGDDCYTSFTAAIASNGDDRYDIQDASSLPGADAIDDVRISIEGGAIVFRYIGDSFDPEFGEGMAGVTETYPAAGVSPSDLTLCD